MRKPLAAAGSVVFFVLGPGVVVGVLPWWLSGWQVREPLPYWLPLRLLGVFLVATGGAALAHAFIRFVVEGSGTPAPVAPPEHLVVGGLYRYVRNPMYLAVLTAIVGQALVFGQPALLLYAVAVCAAVVSFVHWYEEPVLSRRFGREYEAYRSAVPAWRPRLRPWQPLAGTSRTETASGRRRRPRS
jgi:protein-S-isoprenylcysteine O-methyltransferase Ste14